MFLAGLWSRSLCVWPRALCGFYWSYNDGGGGGAERSVPGRGMRAFPGPLRSADLSDCDVEPGRQRAVPRAHACPVNGATRCTGHTAHPALLSAGLCPEQPSEPASSTGAAHPAAFHSFHRGAPWSHLSLQNSAASWWLACGVRSALCRSPSLPTAARPGDSLPSAPPAPAAHGC